MKNAARVGNLRPGQTGEFETGLDMGTPRTVFSGRSSRKSPDGIDVPPDAPGAHPHLLEPGVIGPARYFLRTSGSS